MRRSPKKRGAPLGQHFLTSSGIAHAVAEAGSPREGDTVIEIGPGKGILTRELLSSGAHVIAVEKDPSLAKFLRENFAREIYESRFTIHEGDIRDAAIHTSLFINLKSPYKVIANIPYYITGELIRMFLTAEHQPTTLVFLVQKEVADRIARSKKESLLSLSVKVYGTPSYVKTVKAGSFSPPPSVDSAILAINNITRKNFDTVSEERFFELLHLGFAAKRKTLIGNLKKKYDTRTLEVTWNELGLDAKVRAEDVSLPIWLALSSHLG